MKEQTPGPIVVMGVSGCGKSTVAEALARALGTDWLDADDFHPPENKAKMAAGVPLDDEDRWGWLKTLAEVLESRTKGDPARLPVLACSALKVDYRNRLRVSPGVRFVYLKVAPEVARQRMESRSGHFMNPRLMTSQFQTLEEPDPTKESHVVTLDAREEVSQLVAQTLRALR